VVFFCLSCYNITVVIFFHSVAADVQWSCVVDYPKTVIQDNSILCAMPKLPPRKINREGAGKRTLSVYSSAIGWA
jgi:hypothetical protein